jgi:dTDP-4-dehydrorhamnose reductase
MLPARPPGRPPLPPPAPSASIIHHPNNKVNPGLVNSHLAHACAALGIGPAACYTSAILRNRGTPGATAVSPRLLVTGGSGILGGWLTTLAARQWHVTGTYLTRARASRAVSWRQLDVTDETLVAALFAEVGPDVVVHTAAVSAGDWQEMEQVNVAGTRHVAHAAASCGARLLHLSTDLVFDGQKGNYVEEDDPAPVTQYGRSKALAEQEVLGSRADTVVVRTSLIYSWHPERDRHTRWLIAGLSSGESVRLFTDEIRCPIWVESLARALLELVRAQYNGVLHVAGSQALSRYDYGLRLIRFHGLDSSPIIPGLSRESGLVRPLDTTLDCARARQLLATPLPGLDEVLSTHSAPA